MKNMPGSAQENEFNVFHIPKWLRSGIMIGFLSISLISNWFLYNKVDRLYTEKDKMQEKLYEKMIDYVNPTLQKMDRASNKAEETTVRVDSALNSISQQNK
ncbi:hypothetical protein ACFSJU_14775 [Paradesertivirga mongoliensis]|uniref:Uncharacterized protein n=1 Tax=Paradesertivirga mongoliensis TaxID=2100740 RepID=A0ABW4ZPG3_9SPHI|nr:hypothetical protein [Pedobacter mongoliensis]